MTNPIAIAPKPTPAPATGRIRLDATSAPDFAALIALGETTSAAPGRPIGAPQAQPLATEVTGTPAQTELVAELSGLLEKLAPLSEKLEKGGSLEDEDLQELESLLAGIETLLDQGTPLPAPETPAFAALADFATALGLQPNAGTAGETTPFETLASLSAKIANDVRKEAPELAARLTALTRTLDTHAAAIQTALADEQAIAVTTLRHVESETKLNPAATIAQDPAETAEQKPAQPGSEPAPKETAPVSERSLVKDGQPTAPTGTDTRPAQPQAGAAASGAASTAPAPAELEAPDGLAIGTPQPQTTPAGSSSPMRPEAALYQRPDTQINLPHIAAEISRHVQNGTSRFEIRLNPPELGRIDVRMEMDNSGNVVARLAVERSETLDLLQRDQRSLERALADAGLDSAKTELEFSLQQEGENGPQEGEKQSWRHSTVSVSDPEASITDTKADLNPYMRGYARLDAVNLWV